MDIFDTSNSSYLGSVCPLVTISSINYNYNHVSKRLIRYEFIDGKVELHNTDGDRYEPLHIIIKSPTARINKLHYVINEEIITTIDVELLPCPAYFKYEVRDDCTIYDIKKLGVLIGNVYCDKNNKIRFDLELSENTKAYMNGLMLFDCNDVRTSNKPEHEITRFYYVNIEPKKPDNKYEIQIDMEGCLNGFFVNNISNIKSITVHMRGIEDKNIVTKLYEMDIMMYCTNYAENAVYIPVDISNPNNEVITGSSWCCNRTPRLQFTIETKEPILASFQLIFPLIFKMSYTKKIYKIISTGGDIVGFNVRKLSVYENYRIRYPEMNYIWHDQHPGLTYNSGIHT